MDAMRVTGAKNLPMLQRSIARPSYTTHILYTYTRAPTHTHTHKQTHTHRPSDCARPPLLALSSGVDLVTQLRRVFTTASTPPRRVGIVLGLPCVFLSDYYLTTYYIMHRLPLPPFFCLSWCTLLFTTGHGEQNFPCWLWVAVGLLPCGRAIPFG